MYISMGFSWFSSYFSTSKAKEKQNTPHRKINGRETEADKNRRILVPFCSWRTWKLLGISIIITSICRAFSFSFVASHLEMVTVKLEKVNRQLLVFISIDVWTKASIRSLYFWCERETKPHYKILEKNWFGLFWLSLKIWCCLTIKWKLTSELSWEWKYDG